MKVNINYEACDVCGEDISNDPVVFSINAKEYNPITGKSTKRTIFICHRCREAFKAYVRRTSSPHKSTRRYSYDD